MLNQLNREQLLELLTYYNEYIQEANEENRYKEGWFPVCVSEFLVNDLKEWKSIE